MMRSALHAASCNRMSSPIDGERSASQERMLLGHFHAVGATGGEGLHWRRSGHGPFPRFEPMHIVAGDDVKTDRLPGVDIRPVDVGQNSRPVIRTQAREALILQRCIKGKPLPSLSTQTVRIEAPKISQSGSNPSSCASGGHPTGPL